MYDGLTGSGFKATVDHRGLHAYVLKAEMRAGRLRRDSR